MGVPERVGTEKQDADASTTTVEHRRRRSRSSPRSSTRARHRRLRAVYFSLAALWGFLTGTGAVLIGLAAVGRETGIGPRGSLCVICAAAVALIGGLVVATAYRSATRRYR